MNEFALIEFLTNDLSRMPWVVAGAGDDCAVIDLGLPEAYLLLKTDAVVEGIHFTKEAPPEKVGHKALARNLSDLAAMGGNPSCGLVTLGLPREFDPHFLKAVYGGMEALGRRYGMAIVGGETTSNPDRLLISITVLGTVGKQRLVRRGGAKPGDAIFVTGELGGSITSKHLDFEPRVAEAQWLTEQFAIHSMIDLSDGLAGDLRHVLKSSGVGAEILASAIPISRAARLKAKNESSAKPPLLAALTDGEDFELLFTLPSQAAVQLLDAWKARFPALALSCIGRITPGMGLKIRTESGIRDVTEHGYTHFA
jgi:thiamine-monophosphate kinase